MAAKKTVKEQGEAMKAAAMKELEKSRKMVEKEVAKVKKSIADVAKKSETFMKKNPEKAAAIAAGVGAALGAALALVASGGKKKK